MNTTTQTQEFAFKCGYCLFMRTLEGSKVLGFENGESRVCSYCVKATEYLRSELPIIGE